MAHIEDDNAPVREVWVDPGNPATENKGVTIGLGRPYEPVAAPPTEPVTPLPPPPPPSTESSAGSSAE